MLATGGESEAASFLGLDDLLEDSATVDDLLPAATDETSEEGSSGGAFEYALSDGGDPLSDGGDSGGAVIVPEAAVGVEDTPPALVA